MMKRVALVIALLVLVGGALVSVVVQTEADYRLESLGGAGTAKALVLFHPSRDAGFSDELSLAVAEGIKAAGLQVQRATLCAQTPANPGGYALIAVVSNTYCWAPDSPTLRYLERAQLKGVPVLGLIGGAGSTERSERLLAQALRGSGAQVIATRSFWLWRPNGDAQQTLSNRALAQQSARRFGEEAARAALAAGQIGQMPHAIQASNPHLP
jgi:hypothetical protein